MKEMKKLANATTIGVGGGTYLMFAIAVGMAAGGWTNFFAAVFLGLFWPATLMYELMRVLHHISSSSVLNF